MDGQHSRRVLYQPYSFNIETTWDGFTIQNGQTVEYGGEYPSGYGGGVYLHYNIKLSKCIIRNNYANYGGGIHGEGGTTISNCLISNNTATYFGGGISSWEAVILNSTIVRNTAPYRSGSGVLGMSWFSNLGCNLSNCIVWGNGQDVTDNLAGKITCSYSAIEGGFPGEQNIPLFSPYNQPLFVNPTQHSGTSDTIVEADWHLQPGSACINRGKNSAIVDSIDLNGVTRVINDTVDLGCYESTQYSYPLIEPNYSNVICL